MRFWQRGAVVMAVAVATIVAAALAAAAIAVTVAGPKAATRAGAVSSHTCSPTGARTVVANREVRVYSLPGGGTGLFGPPRRLYACLLRGGRTTALGSSDGRQRVAGETLTGHMLALARELMGVDTLSSTVEVLDVASGRTLHHEAATGPVLGPESAVIVYRMEVDPHGNLAWLASQASIVGTRAKRYEVHRVNRTGATLLDAGPAIAADSLRRHGETVTWLDGASQRSGRLA